jgi:subtilase family serine protease
LLGALSLGALLLGGAALGYAQDDTSAAVRPRPTPSRLVDPIDERALVTLKGNVRADVAHAPDLGAVEDAKPLNLFLLLQRSTAQQADLDSLIARQQEPGAPEYHKWLTPAEFGARFGASPQDITKLSTWLQSHGFKIRSVLNNASMIDFEATAGQVREAFHAQLHYVSVRGGKYPALRQDPQIPAALIPVVAGIEGLNKIPPQANHGAPRQASRDQATHRWHIVNPTPADTASPDYSDGSGDYLVGPQDLYTIYKINPVFTGGNLAATATVAVIEQSDIEYGTVTSGVATGGDVATFRSVFGVPGTLNMHVYHGYGSVTCNDPGITYADEFEASIDAEWINATAPSANLIFMSCDDDPDDGILSSMTALIDNNLSDAMSLSYGESELDYTSANYTFQDDLYEQAATQGQSAVISAGDGGSDVADTHGVATVGVNVSGLSSSPLVTSAGGTDFQDYYDAQENGKPQSTYWNSTNSTYYGDAISYIPETAWNQSCAGSLIAELAGYPGAAYCAYFGTVSPFEGSGLGGSGGISTHYAAPAWQTGISGYSNPMRSQPDIAGFASSFWFHALLLCDSNPDDGDPCTSPSTFGASDGTSFVAPYTAGEVGLLVAATGSRQGVLNPALYALAKAQYAAPATATACYANGQTSNTGVTTSLPAAACIFNDVTTGNNDVPCTAGSTDCFANSGASYGILSLTGSSSLTVAYASAAGYDQVTGIGSVNVANLIADWNTAFTSNTALQANPTSINSIQSTDLTATVTGGTPTGYVDAPPAVTGTITFKAGTTVVGNCTLSSGTCNATVLASSLQMGANSMTAIFGGSGTYPSFTSSIVTVTVETSSLITPTVTVTPSSLSITTTQALSVTVVVSGGSGNPVPTGTVTLSGGGYSSAATTLSGGSASIMSETTHMASQFKDEKTGETKFQDVAKVLFSGETETKNISLNRATINGLVDAYGEESADWQNHVLTCETEKMRVGGRAVTAVYLVPENYERVDDENGYTVIVKSGTKVGAPEELPSVDF